MSSAPAKPYPLTFDVDLQLRDRNRTTCFFRLILAWPHVILVGWPGLLFGWLISAPFFLGAVDRGVFFNLQFVAGAALARAASTMSLIAWFGIIFWRTHPQGLWDFGNFYLRWRSKALAYIGLLRDEYPPFGDGDYPVQFSLGEKPDDKARNIGSIFFRFALAIPHYLILVAMGVLWLVTAFIAWLAILFTGAYPEGLYRYAIGYMRWSLRVEAYTLLLRDEYPPFSLE